MEKTKIEWCDSSWNPISGCYHDCPYCYARGTAKRFSGCDKSPEGTAEQKTVVLDSKEVITHSDGIQRTAAYPYGFTPTFHKYRLADPYTKGFGKTIFVCSMADMFGEWVPDEWIAEIFEACRKADNHRYLFLTKNPRRYIELACKGMLPQKDNFWYGTTATKPTSEVFFAEGYHTFVSFEPVLEPFTKQNEGFCKSIEWAIIGAETGNRKDKVVPQKEWIDNISDHFRESGKPVFMKDSLIPIMGTDNMIMQFPWND